MKSKLKTTLLAMAVGGVFLYLSDVHTAIGDIFARDPGVRGGDPGAGGPMAGLTANELRFFNHGKEDFEEAEEVDEGLGPRMNLDSCGGCHIQPATGGSSPAVNPQVAFARKDGGRDRVPSFVNLNGPI